MQRWLLLLPFSVPPPCIAEEVFLPADVDVSCDFFYAKDSDMTEDMLQLHFSEQARPTIITGLTGDWAANQKWTVEQLVNDYGDIPVSTSEMTNGFRAMWDFSEQLYVRDVINSSLIFFTNQEMGDGLRKDMGQLPAYLQRHSGLLGMSLGSRGAYATHHDHKPSWFAQIKGRKLWVVTPPHVPHEWSRSYPDVCQMPEEAFVGLDVKRCIAKPGEVLYLPANWGHSTCNLDHAISAGVIGSFHNSITYAVQTQNARVLQDIMQREEFKDPGLQGDAIHTAATYGHTKIVSLLLRQGVSVHGAEDGLLPVMEAAGRGHADVVKYLTLRGADPWPDNDTQAFDVACLNGHISVVEELFGQCEDCVVEDLGKDSTPLHWAAQEGHIPVMDFLFSHDNSTPSPNRDKQAFMLAAQHGHVAGVQRMMARGVDPSDVQARDGGREHALHVAAVSGHFRVVDRLLQQGVAPDAVNHHNDQPIHQAALVGVAGMVSHLMAARADPKAASGQGSTPLALAQARGHKAVIDILAEGGGAHDEL